MTTSSTASMVRVPIWWLALVGLLAAVLTAWVLSIAGGDTIELRKVTVDRAEICNPTNADAADISEQPNNGANICVFKADGSQTHQPYLNRLARDSEHAKVFSKQPVTLLLARMPSLEGREITESVIDAETPEE